MYNTSFAKCHHYLRVCKLHREGRPLYVIPSAHYSFVQLDIANFKTSHGGCYSFDVQCTSSEPFWDHHRRHCYVWDPCSHRNCDAHVCSNISEQFRIGRCECYCRWTSVYPIHNLCFLSEFDRFRPGYMDCWSRKAVHFSEGRRVRYRFGWALCKKLIVWDSLHTLDKAFIFGALASPSFAFCSSSFEFFLLKE